MSKRCSTYAALGLFFTLHLSSLAWSQESQPAKSVETEQASPAPTPSTLVLPSPPPSAKEGETVQIVVQPDRWDLKVAHSQPIDTLSVTAQSPLGHIGKTYAQWINQDQKDSLEAGLSASFFGSDHLVARHRIDLANRGQSKKTTTDLGLGIDLQKRTKISFWRSFNSDLSEFKTDLVYQTPYGFQLVTAVKTQPDSPDSLSTLWKNPVIQGQVKLTW